YGQPDRAMVDSKYRAPQFGIDLIDRPLLLDQLEAGLRAVLTLVHGPAGYGKTALLVQWRQRLAALGVESAWVSLDEDDRAAGHLIESIAAACGEAAGFGDVASGAELDARRFAAGVLLRLGQRARPLTLILDDYHRAQSSANDGILAFLIARAPEN